MTDLIEHLKVAENSVKSGLKKDGWHPHASYEKGTDTLAYGHKLSAAEHKGGYVVLPDGSVHDFSNGGLTEQQAQDLLLYDIKKHKSLARVQWDKGNKDVKFDALAPVHQDLLTEIAYNIGGLNNKTGAFGWKKLAKAIKTGDIKEIKAQSGRSANGAPLKERNKQVEDFIDNWKPMPAPVVPATKSTTAPIQGQPSSKNVAPAAPQKLLRPTTATPAFNAEDEAIIQQMMKGKKVVDTEEVTDFSDEDEVVIAQMMNMTRGDAVATEEAIV